MDVRIWAKIIENVSINLASSWFAAVLILPNFISVSFAVFGLISTISNGTMLLLVAYGFKKKYGS